MTRTTKATVIVWAISWLLLCGACDDEPIDAGGVDGGAGDAGADGDADADADADPCAVVVAAYEAERAAHAVPGLSLAIVVNDELACSQVLGEKDRDSGDPVTRETQFRYVNTHFPPLALLQLVDKGDVALTDRLSEHVPEFNVTELGWLEPSDQQRAVDSITIGDLLLGTSCLEYGGGLPTTWEDRADSVLDEYLTSDEFAGDHHMLCHPGQQQFGNILAGSLMALVVERVTEATGDREYFSDYVDDHIFEPLGMASSTYRAEEVEARGEYATAYDPENLHAPTQRDNPWMRPVFGLWTTANDLALFAEFLLHGNEDVLSQEWLEWALSTTPQVNIAGWDRIHPSALGFLTSDGPCVSGGICPAAGDLREHEVWGRFMGDWTTEFLVVPSRDFALVRMANAPPFFPDSDQLALTTLLDLPPLVPDYPGDDHDASVYEGPYRLDNGGTATVRTVRGALHLSSPACDLEPLAPGTFQCDDDWVWFVFDTNDEVQYLVTAGYLAVPDANEGQ